MERSSPSNSSIFRRILIFLIPFLILLTLAFFQIFNLMILSADEFKTQADSNRILKERVFPPRGLILDRNEEIVVENFIRQDLKVTPSFVEDYSLYISNLSELLNYETSKIEDIFYKKLNEIKPFQSFTLIRNLTDEQIAKLNLNLNKFAGTEIIPNFSRNVIQGESLGSVVGYLGFASKNFMLQDPNLKNFSDQQIGLLGIEKEYDNFLRGEIGYKFLEKDSKGTVIKVLSSEPPKKGKKIKVECPTTYFSTIRFQNGTIIRLTLSFDVISHLRNHIELYGEKGSMIVPDPNMFGGSVLLSTKLGSKWKNYKTNKMYAVKEAVFPFNKFPNTDVILGPEMKSTGEVMGIDEDFYLAYFKSQIGAGQKLNDLKNIFISVKNEDKQSISEIAKSFIENGYNLYTTKGTHDFLLKEGISSNLVNKVAEGSPHVVEYIKQNKIDLVINTTEKKQAIIDSFTIRRTSVDLNIPYYTNLRSAEILIKSLITLKNKPISVKPIQIHHSF